MANDSNFKTLPDEVFTDFDKRNPMGAAFYLCDKIDQEVQKVRKPSLTSSFIEDVFGKMWNECSEISEEFPEGYIKQMLELEMGEQDLTEKQNNRIHGYAFIATAYCIVAMKAQKSERVNFAWNMIAEAHFWAGAMYSAFDGIVGSFLSKSEMAKKGAKAAHKENHALRELIWDWYKNNGLKYKSMAQAADAAFSANLAPVTHRTIYDWIRQLSKGESS